ncbi:hypothetical protein ACHAPT_009179 [Fusarium lateritium]
MPYKTPDYPIPPPYDASPPDTCLDFRRFYNRVGRWPWELVRGFEPDFWTYHLVREFIVLLKVHLLDAPSVTLDELIDFLREKSAYHPHARLAGKFNRMAIKAAVEWLAEKQDTKASPAPSVSTLPSFSPDKEPQEVNENEQEMAARQMSPHREDAALPTSPCLRACKRVMHIPDDDPESDLDIDSPAPKKRLMVDPKLTQLEVQEARESPAPIVSDCITVATRPPELPVTDSPGEPGEQPGTQSHPSIEAPSNHVVVREEPSAPGLNGTPTETPLDPHTVYVAYLESQILQSNIIAHRAQNEIDAISQEHRRLLESVRACTEAKSQATTELTRAQKSLQDIAQRCAAEADVQQELRRPSDKHSSVVSPELLATMESYGARQRALQVQKTQAGVELSARLKHFTDVSNKLQMAEHQTAPVESKIEKLREIKERGECQKRSFTLFRRLVGMGPHPVGFLEGAMGKDGLEAWTQEKLREIGREGGSGAA